MTVTIIVGLLSAFFLLAGSVKVLGWQKTIFETQLRMFESYGMNRQIMFLVGLAELFGAVAIWFQGSWLGLIGTLALLATSAGAIFCHLVFDTWKDGVPAMITGLFSAILLWSGRGDILALFVSVA